MAEKKDDVQMTQDRIKELVARDLAVAVTTINAIRNDPEMLNAMAEIIGSRIRTEQENKKSQPEMFD